MSDDKVTEEEVTTTQTSGDDVQKLQDKIQRLQGMLTTKEKDYNRVVSVYKDIDPDEYRSLRQKLEEKEREAAEKDPQKMEELFQRKLDRVRSDLESERNTLKEQVDALSRVNKTLAVTDRVMSEIGGLFNTDAVKWIKREVEEFCDLDEDGSIVVKDDNGDVLYKGARPMTLKEYGESLVEKYPSLAKASGVSGVKDATPGVKSGVRVSNKIPQTFAELQAMPNAKEVLERLKREDPAAVQKILRSISTGK
jgi:F0F1-type ATP synthase membrane subunit b/b'